MLKLCGYFREVMENMCPLTTLGVVSYNCRRSNHSETFLEEARRLAGRPDVQVIGWQEAFNHGRWFPHLRDLGWETAWFDGDGVEVPISWAADELDLVDVEVTWMHESWPGKKRPKPARFVSRVDLRHRATGHLLSVLNTHVTARIESRVRPGHWRDASGYERALRHFAELARLWSELPGRWSVGTADLNFDFRAESRIRPRGGPTDRLDGLARSNWQALGTDDIDWTVISPVDGAPVLFDYVYAGRQAVERGWMAFRDQRVLEGFASDHRPLLVRFDLS